MLVTLGKEVVATTQVGGPHLHLAADRIVVVKSLLIGEVAGGELRVSVAVEGVVVAGRDFQIPGVSIASETRSERPVFAEPDLAGSLLALVRTEDDATVAAAPACTEPSRVQISCRLGN